MASDTLRSAACAAATFDSFPSHALRHDVCSALPYENERVHGFFLASEEALFIKSRWAVASSSLFKSAVYGRDPNWGRIACAAGYAGE